MYKSQPFRVEPFTSDLALSFYAESVFKVQQSLFDAVYLIGVLQEDKYRSRLPEQEALINDYFRAKNFAKIDILYRLRLK